MKGDLNTKFFHSGRKKKNTILGLENDGCLIEGDENLLIHATEYYAELFGPVQESDIQIDPALWEN